MARPKTKLQQLLAGQTIAAEACARFGYNPFVEMIKCANEVVVLKPEDKLETFGEWWHNWDLVTRPDGIRMFVVHRSMRLEVAKAIAPYVAPQLKSTENRTTEDKTITWVIKTFAPETTELSIVKAKEIEG